MICSGWRKGVKLLKGGHAAGSPAACLDACAPMRPMPLRASRPRRMLPPRAPLPPALTRPADDRDAAGRDDCSVLDEYAVWARLVGWDLNNPGDQAAQQRHVICMLRVRARDVDRLPRLVHLEAGGEGGRQGAHERGAHSMGAGGRGAGRRGGRRERGSSCASGASARAAAGAWPATAPQQRPKRLAQPLTHGCGA